MATPELTHLSYSSISAYQTCARSWKYKYLDKLKAPATPALAFGSAWHRLIEDALLARHRGESLDLAGHWQTCWNNQTEGEEIVWNGELPEQLVNDGHRMLASKDTSALLSSLHLLAENDEPVIEKRIELRVPGVPVPVVGFIDLITADGTPGDIKTTARAWTAEQAANETQPLFYLAALSQSGYQPNYRFRHYVFGKGRTAQVQVLETIHRPAALFWLYKAIKDVWHGIEAGVFHPSPGSWKCSERFCDYWVICRGRK